MVMYFPYIVMFCSFIVMYCPYMVMYCPYIVMYFHYSYLLLFHSHLFRLFNFKFDSYFVLDCHQKYTASSGLVTSPNYPFNYQRNSDCGFLIEAPVGQKITLYAVSFDVESGAGCAFDYLAIYDGKSNASQMLTNRRWCGKTLPPTLQSSNNTMFLRYKTDQSVSNSGFAFSYSASIGE